MDKCSPCGLSITGEAVTQDKEDLSGHYELMTSMLMTAWGEVPNGTLSDV